MLKRSSNISFLSFNTNLHFKIIVITFIFSPNDISSKICFLLCQMKFVITIILSDLFNKLRNKKFYIIVLLIFFFCRSYRIAFAFFLFKRASKIKRNDFFINLLLFRYFQLNHHISTFTNHNLCIF